MTKCSVSSRTGRILTEMMFLIVSLALLLSPILGGVRLQASSHQDQVVMMFGRDGWEEDSLELSLVLVSRINNPQPGDASTRWTQVVVGDHHISSQCHNVTMSQVLMSSHIQTVTCSEEISQVTNTSRILLADLHDETCLKLLSNQELMRGKSDLILVLQTGKRERLDQNYFILLSDWRQDLS